MIQLQQLSNSSYDIPIRFVIFANDHEISRADTSVNKLKDHPELTMLDIKG